MIKLSEKTRRVLRAVYRGLGVTAVSFIFQACYGPPPDGGYDIPVRGMVKSKKTDAPISGIKVSADYSSYHKLTDTDGEFYILVPRAPIQDHYTVKIKFEDVDGQENGGLFKKKEITLSENNPYLDVELEEDEE